MDWSLLVCLSEVDSYVMRDLLSLPLLLLQVIAGEWQVAGIRLDKSRLCEEECALGKAELVFQSIAIGNVFGSACLAIFRAAGVVFARLFQFVCFSHSCRMRVWS